MKRATLFLLLALACCRCAASVDARFLTIYVQDRPFRVEIADTPAQHALGLMHRRSLPEDRGMLFVFAEDEFRSFWMKNTLIPLDIIFLNRDGQVLGLHESAPPCLADPCPNYESELPARFVLEIAGGTARKLGLKVGDRVFIPPLAAAGPSA